MADMPCARDLREYLTGAGLTSAWTDIEISAALDAEAAAQARACRIPSDEEEWPDDLAEALRRRVARSLASRKTPLGFQVIGDLETARVSSRDPEVTRLEAPYRRWVVA